MLRPYQKTARSFAINTPRCNLLLDMGLGKTLTSLTVQNDLAALDDRPTLVLAPLRVANTVWGPECAKWPHLDDYTVSTVTGDVRQRSKALTRTANMYVTNYESIPWLVQYFGNSWPFGTVIADESSKLKSFRLRKGSRRAAELAKVAHKCERWLNLTGTFSPNGLHDVWGQMWFVDGGQRLGRTYTGFHERYFRPAPNGYGSVPVKGALEDITEAIADVTLTLQAKDFFDLPPLIVNTIGVTLPPAARKLYDDMELRLFLELQGREVEAFQAAEKSMKCLQIANGAIYPNDERAKKNEYLDVHDAKLDALDSVLSEANGKPVLCAYNFKADADRIKRRFKFARDIKEPGVQALWDKGEVPLMLAHPKSAGHGLNLQHGGNIAVFFGHWWSLEERAQFIERIGPTRQAQSGYKRPVYVHDIIALDTVDEVVQARQKSKADVSAALLDYLKRKRG